MRRSILFVTGTRADFGKLEPLAIAARDAGLDVSFFVTGMHMLARYGLTKIEVQRMPGVTVHEYLNQRSGDPQDIILAKTVTGFSDFVREDRPDLVVIHGDRVEALACALVCATNYIRSAHIEGGEVSGTIDEIYRHCNSKLASHHFVSSDDAARRVKALGEDGANVHVIGSPELDFHAGPSGVSLAEVKTRYAIPFETFGICTFHPVTSEAASMGQQAADLFETLRASDRPFVVIAPNNDPGSEGIFEAINTLPTVASMPLTLRAYLAATHLVQLRAKAHLQKRMARGKEHPDRWTEKLGNPTQDRPKGTLIWLHAISFCRSTRQPTVAGFWIIGSLIFVSGQNKTFGRDS